MRYVSDADADAFRRDRAARRSEEARRAAAADFPLYGLPDDWTGVRVLSGVAWQTGVPLTSVELTHVAPPGDFYDRSSARLVVVTSVEPPPRVPAARRRDLARDLRAALDLPAFPPDQRLSGAERRAWLQDPERALAAVGRPEAGTATIPVDRHPVEFTSLALAGIWVAAATLGDHPPTGTRVHLRTLRVQAHHWDPAQLARTGLTRLPDLGPYVAGRNALPPTGTDR